MNRRTFLQSSVAATAIGPAVFPSAASEETGMPIIDTHQHLWDLDRFKLAWVTPESPLARSYTPADYTRATEGLNVVHAIYMEVDVVPEQQVAEAESILRLIEGGETRTVAAVISGRPNSEGFGAYLDRFRGKSAIKGIRQVLHASTTPSGYCLDPGFVRGIRLLGDRGLSFDLCMRAPELADGAKLIDACPDTRFILDHCGNEPVTAKDHSAWKRDIDALASKGDRVVCKVSGIVASAKGTEWTPADLAPIVNHVLDAFGPDRVMFGGDWPVCTLAATYGQWLDALKSIVRGRPEAERRKLFHDNARRFYGLT